MGTVLPPRRVGVPHYRPIFKLAVPPGGPGARRRASRRERLLPAGHPGNWHLDDVSVVAHASAFQKKPERAHTIQGPIIAITPKSKEIGLGWEEKPHYIYFNFLSKFPGLLKYTAPSFSALSVFTSESPRPTFVSPSLHTLPLPIPSKSPFVVSTHKQVDYECRDNMYENGFTLYCLSSSSSPPQQCVSSPRTHSKVLETPYRSS